MKSFLSKKFLTVFFISFAAFFITTVIANKYLLAFDVSSVRISAALNPVLGIVFGWPAILGCAVGNFLSDIVSGWGIITALMGFPSQILYGFFPYFVWRRFIGCKSHITRLDRPQKVFVLILIIPVAFRALFFQILRAQIKPLNYTVSTIINQFLSIGISYILMKYFHLGAYSILLGMCTSIIIIDFVLLCQIDVKKYFKWK